MDSLLGAPQLLDENEKQLFRQYYKLREALRKYRELEKSGDWEPIETNPLVPIHRPGDSSRTNGQIRHRLFVMGDLQKDSKNNNYHEELVLAVLNFRRRNGYKSNFIIGPQEINRMNIPLDKYIKTVVVNMERCRSIPPTLTKEPEFIIVNVPSFTLIYFKNSQRLLQSKVFVEIKRMETFLFSSSISRFVFSPYWNVPRSIIENKIKPAMAKDPDYLEQKNIE